MKERFWPWKRFASLEAQVVTLQGDLNREKMFHTHTKEEHKKALETIKLHEANAVVRDKHTRKMAQIIALTGGIIG